MYPLKAAIAGGELLVGGDIILDVGGIAVTPDGAGLLKVWDYVNGLKTGDVITVKVLRAGQIVELKTSLPAR